MSGLQGYLEGVKGQSMQHRQDFQLLLEEKEALEEKIRRLEAELAILDTEAQNAKVLQKVSWDVVVIVVMVVVVVAYD